MSSWPEILALARTPKTDTDRSRIHRLARENIFAVLDALKIPDRREDDLPSRLLELACTSNMTVEEYSETILGNQLLSRIRSPRSGEPSPQDLALLPSTIEKLSRVWTQDWSSRRLERIGLHAECLRNFGRDDVWKDYLSEVADDERRADTIDAAYGRLKRALEDILRRNVGPNVSPLLEEYALRMGMLAGEYSYYERALTLRRNTKNGRELTRLQAVEVLTAFYVFINRYKDHCRSPVENIRVDASSAPPAKATTASPSAAPMPMHAKEGAARGRAQSDATVPTPDTSYWRRVLGDRERAESLVPPPAAAHPARGSVPESVSTQSNPPRQESPDEFWTRITSPRSSTENMGSTSARASPEGVLEYKVVNDESPSSNSSDRVQLPCPWCSRIISLARRTAELECLHCRGRLKTELRPDTELSLRKHRSIDLVAGVVDTPASARTPDYADSRAPQSQRPPIPWKTERADRDSPPTRLNTQTSASIEHSRGAELSAEQRVRSRSDTEMASLAAVVVLFLLGFGVIFAMRPTADSFVLLSILGLSAPYALRWVRRNDDPSPERAFFRAVGLSAWICSLLVVIAFATSWRRDIFRVEKLPQVFVLFQRYPFKAWGTLWFTIVPPLVLLIFSAIVQASRPRTAMRVVSTGIFVVGVVLVVGLQDCVGCVPAE